VLAYGVGRLLLQEGEINPKTFETMSPTLCFYLAATFTPTERNYDIYEFELLAVVTALLNKTGDHTSLGCPSLTLITSPTTPTLTFWKHSPESKQRVAQWFAAVARLLVRDQARPGKTHTAADFLSRPFATTRANKIMKML